MDRKAIQYQRDPNDRTWREIEPEIQRLVGKVVSRIGVGERDDLLQVGVIGVFKYLGKFDPRIASFSTFVCRMATYSIQKYLIQSAPIIREPDGVVQDRLEYRRQYAGLQAQLGRMPTTEEFLRHAKLTSAELLKVGLDDPAKRLIALEDMHSDPSYVRALTADSPSPEAVAINKLIVRDILDSLSEKEQDILLMRYRDGKTLGEIGAKYNCSREYIRLVIARARAKCRSKLRR